MVTKKKGKTKEKNEGYILNPPTLRRATARDGYLFFKVCLFFLLIAVNLFSILKALIDVNLNINIIGLFSAIVNVKYLFFGM